MLFKAAYHKLRIAEIPIKLNPRNHGISHIKLNKLTVSIVSCIFVYGLKRFKVKKIVPKGLYNFVRYLFFKKIN